MIFKTHFQRKFVCRSADFNYGNLQCRLSEYDRRTLVDGEAVTSLVSAPGVDYFENLCLSSKSNKVHKHFPFRFVMRLHTFYQVLNSFHSNEMIHKLNDYFFVKIIEMAAGVHRCFRSDGSGMN